MIALDTPFVAHESRRKFLPTLLGCCVFAGGSIFVLRMPAVWPHIAGIASLVMIGACTSVVLYRLVRPRCEVLVLDGMGFRDRRLFDVLVPWEAITGATLTTIMGSSFIGVELDRWNRVPRRIAGRLNAAAGFSAVNVGLEFLDRRPEEIAAAFFIHLDLYGVRRPPPPFGDAAPPVVRSRSRSAM